VIVRSFKEKRREGRFRERYFKSLWRGGRALEVENSREQGSRPGLNIRGQSGIRLATWVKSSKRQLEAEEVFNRSARTEARRETFFATTLLEKSSEERSPGVLGAERGFRGRNGANTIERVAKP
jgi:hypothetical protein